MYITDVISHRERDKLRAERRASKEIARVGVAHSKDSSPDVAREVKRTHNLRYRFHDRVRQEVKKR